MFSFDEQLCQGYEVEVIHRLGSQGAHTVVRDLDIQTMRLVQGEILPEYSWSHEKENPGKIWGDQRKFLEKEPFELNVPSENVYLIWPSDVWGGKMTGHSQKHG